MAGQEQVNTSDGAIRREKLEQRYDDFAQFMRDKTPIAIIADIYGLEPDQVRKTCRRIAAERGIDYKPVRAADDALPPGMTDASRTLRNHLANTLDKHKVASDHRLDVCREIGLTQAAQKAATTRPNPHNWSLSQIERLADSTGQDFTVMVLQGLLSPTRFEKVMRCLNS